MLYFVPTPIGNLGDITLRALETLQSVDVIYAEDTRRTKQLLHHFDINKRVLSYYEHNKIEAGADIIGLLKDGTDVALVSDAGMPCISDPGVDIAELCVNEGLTFTVLPGATAFATAFAASAFKTGYFCFEGFLPKNKKHKIEHLKRVAKDDRVHIFYESPHALLATLEAILTVFGNRKIFIGRELTKLHEEYLRGSVSEVLAHFKEEAPRGEFVLVVEGAEQIERVFDTEKLEQAMKALAGEEISTKRIAAILSDLTGENKKEIYRHISEIRQ